MSRKTNVALALEKAGAKSPEEMLAEAVAFAYGSAPRELARAMDLLSTSVFADLSLCWAAFGGESKRILGDLLRKEAERQRVQAVNAVQRNAPRGAAGERGHFVAGTQCEGASPPAFPSTAGISGVIRVAVRTILDTLTFDGKEARYMTRDGLQDYARRKGAKAWAADAIARMMPPVGTVEDAHISAAEIETIWQQAQTKNIVEVGA